MSETAAMFMAQDAWEAWMATDPLDEPGKDCPAIVYTIARRAYQMGCREREASVVGEPDHPEGDG